MIGTCHLVVVVQASKLHYLLWESKKFNTPTLNFLGIGSQSCRFLLKLDRPPHAQLQLLMNDWTMAMPGRGLANGHMDAAFTPYLVGGAAFYSFTNQSWWQQLPSLTVLIWGAFKKYDVKGLILKSSLKKKKDTQHMENVLNGSCTLWWLHIRCRAAPVQWDYCNILNAVGRSVCGRGYSKRVGDVTPTTMQEVEPWVTVILCMMTLSIYLSISMQFYL